MPPLLLNPGSRLLPGVIYFLKNKQSKKENWICYALWTRYAKIIISLSLSFSVSQRTHVTISTSLLSSEHFRFRVTCHYHRSTTRSAFLRPWEDLRRIWVRFAGGLALIECYLSPTRVAPGQAS